MGKDYLGKLEELVKDFDIDIIELVKHNKNCFGIKVQILDQVYLFTFEGTLNELSKNLINEYNELSKHKIFCPYCNEEIKPHEFESLCKCGINIIHEVSKPNEISYLVEESGGKEAIKHNGWKVWFLDDKSMKKFEYIKTNTKKYFNKKFDEYIKNNKYKHINSYKIVDNKYELNGIEFIITRSDYFKIISEICLKYCDWIRNGCLYDLNFDNDPYYDNSGSLELISDGNMYKNIKSFENVYDWVSNCYTGNKRPTFCSGMGFSHDTFYDQIKENINFESIIYQKMNITEEDDIYEELILSDESFDIGYDIEYVVMGYLEEMTTLQCWNDYKDYK
jgi:hypothetical protein